MAVEAPVSAPAFLEAIPYLIHATKVIVKWSIGPAILFMYIRGHFVHQCFHCGAKKVRAAHPFGLLDRALGWVFVRPHRCQGCNRRFYAMRLSGWSLYPYVPGRKKGLISIVFKREGVLIRRVIVHESNLYYENKKPGSLTGNPALVSR